MAKANALSGIRKWLERDEWAEPFDQLLEVHLDPPCEAAGIEMDELTEVIGDDLASSAFVCVFEDMLASELDDGSNIIDDYLKRRGWKESAANKRYMTALRSSVMSLYEVSDIVRGQSFLARDVLRGGEPVKVSEKLATRAMSPWDLVGARIVKVGTRYEMAEGALPMRREVGEMFRETFAGLREEMREKIREWQKPGEAELEPYAFDTEVLRRAAFVFTHTWLEDILLEDDDSDGPTLANSDGEAIELTAVRYPLKPGADRKALADLLGAIAGLRAAGGDHWDWGGPPVQSAPVDGMEDVERFVPLLPDGSILLGTVDLDDEALTLGTNSSRRAERGRALLDPVIGPFVEDPLVESRTMEEMAESQLAEEEEFPSSDLSPEEEHEFVRETLNRHYRAVLDQPIPALGDVSPRESARTIEGRERLASWLKGLENMNAQLEPGSAISSYDTRWIWEELGVLDLRR